MIILLHSSKTMRTSLGDVHNADVPLFMSEAQQLVSYIRTLSVQELSSVMKISSELARKTKHIYGEWSTKQTTQIPAIDCFLGDIYSGFQVSSLSHKDRAYAHQHLRIIGAVRLATSSRRNHSLPARDGLPPP